MKTFNEEETGKDMTVGEVVEWLSTYDKNAKLGVLYKDTTYFDIGFLYGYSEGCSKNNCEHVLIEFSQTTSVTEKEAK